MLTFDRKPQQQQRRAACSQKMRSSWEKKFTIFHTLELEERPVKLCGFDHVLSIILGNDLIVDRDRRSFLPYSANSLIDPPYMEAAHPRASIQPSLETSLKLETRQHQ